MNEVLYINTKSARLGQHRSSLEELPPPEARGGGWEEQRHTEARDGGQEEQPHVQGAVTMQVQEGLEEPSHIEGQEGQQ